MRAEHLLDESAQRFTRRAAVVADNGRAYSYGEVALSVDRVAAALVRSGLRSGERVGLLLGDGVEAVISTFAIFKAGAVVAPIGARIEPTDVAALLRRSGVVALITDARRASLARLAMAAVPAVRLVVLAGGDPATASGSCLVFEALTRGLGNGPPFEPLGQRSESALLLPAIDGSGLAIASAMTHAEYIAAATAPIASDDRRRGPALLSVAGLCRLLAAIRDGATLVLGASTVVTIPESAPVAG
jgi:fatty-acyl-CoA synthase/long-chain acyl-CoA synthetase